MNNVKRGVLRKKAFPLFVISFLLVSCSNGDGVPRGLLEYSYEEDDAFLFEGEEVGFDDAKETVLADYNNLKGNNAYEKLFPVRVENSWKQPGHYEKEGRKVTHLFELDSYYYQRRFNTGDGKESFHQSWIRPVDDAIWSFTYLQHCDYEYITGTRDDSREYREHIYRAYQRDEQSLSDYYEITSDLDFTRDPSLIQDYLHFFASLPYNLALMSSYGVWSVREKDGIYSFYEQSKKSQAHCLRVSKGKILSIGEIDAYGYKDSTLFFYGEVNIPDTIPSKCRRLMPNGGEIFD